MKKNNMQKIVTVPTGTASFPHLQVADTFMNKTTYNVKIVLDKAKLEVQQFVDALKAFADEVRTEEIKTQKENLEALPVDNTPKGKKKRQALVDLIAELEEGSEYKLPIQDEYDRETGDPTGNIIFSAKNNEGFKRSDGTFQSLRPRIYDGKGQLLSPEQQPEIRGGAQLNLKSQLVAYCAGGQIGAGLSARISGVQIVSLTGGAGMGFGAIEGGYEASASSPAPDSIEADTASFSEEY